ncbi:unnamed protein product [Caenorhabditis bovis]|uniref:RRM domain-containing protein n=1 Tax=Caenorhabditis bovis TaxID=2654633 RepID=A0A8S1EEJ6_9PELO|nr:unnamed protein product [Caenorhabditis bovis]
MDRPNQDEEASTANVCDQIQSEEPEENGEIVSEDTSLVKQETIDSEGEIADVSFTNLSDTIKSEAPASPDPIPSESYGSQNFLTESNIEVKEEPKQEKSKREYKREKEKKEKKHKSHKHKKRSRSRSPSAKHNKRTPSTSPIRHSSSRDVQDTPRRYQNGDKKRESKKNLSNNPPALLNRCRQLIQIGENQGALINDEDLRICIKEINELSQCVENIQSKREILHEELKEMIKEEIEHIKKIHGDLPKHMQNVLVFERNSVFIATENASNNGIPALPPPPFGFGFIPPPMLGKFPPPPPGLPGQPGMPFPPPSGLATLMQQPPPNFQLAPPPFLPTMNVPPPPIKSAVTVTITNPSTSEEPRRSPKPVPLMSLAPPAVPDFSKPPPVATETPKPKPKSEPVPLMSKTFLPPPDFVSNSEISKNLSSILTNALKAQVSQKTTSPFTTATSTPTKNVPSLMSIRFLIRKPSRTIIGDNKMYGPIYPPELAEMIQAGVMPYGMMNRTVPAPWAVNGYPPMIHPLELHQMLRQVGMSPMPYHDSPPQLRKLFIGGLSHDTTDEQLGNYFAQWGPVIDAIVIRDPNTKHSRGFGFVTFASIFSADAAMNDRPHVIGGKTVDSKRAIPREQMLSMIPPPFFDNDPAPGCKLLLSGIVAGVHSVDALRIYFETFGTLDQVEILGHPRGLGFVIYEEKESADKCLAHNNGRHVVNERKIDVRVFVKTPTGSTYWKRPQTRADNRSSLYSQLADLNIKDSDSKSGTDTTGNSSRAGETPQHFDEESNYGGTTTEDDCNLFEHDDNDECTSQAESSASQTK